MEHLLDMTVGELEAAMERLGQPPYRGRQVGTWLWRKAAASFAEMTNLPAGLRGRLAERFCILSARVAHRRRADDGTEKLLLELADGERVETVAIPERNRLTACVSTQVGCATGCAFCATGLDGLVRNLSAGEIVEQVFHLQRSCRQRVTNVVFMGMGEPLANYDATVAAVRAMIDPQRLGLSARHVTVSTVGLPKPIRRLAGEKLPITLAISLHAPNDALRRQLVPAAASAGLAAILDAAEAFYHSRRREVTLEYVLLAGVNDTKVCAEGLARIARRLRCSVNLIRYNPVPELPFERPGKPAVDAFVRHVRRHGVNVHVRRSRGLDVSAACGQLRQAARQKSVR
jgi:23S rRNA (adenine2503-C2)-methyltransferase